MSIYGFNEMKARDCRSHEVMQKPKDNSLCYSTDVDNRAIYGPSLPTGTP
jgi:hypothetical protein